MTNSPAFLGSRIDLVEGGSRNRNNKSVHCIQYSLVLFGKTPLPRLQRAGMCLIALPTLYMTSYMDVSVCAWRIIYQLPPRTLLDICRLSDS